MLLLAVPESDHSTLLVLATSILVIYTTAKYLEARRSPLNAIPTIGHSGILTSYITASKWVQSAADLIQEGYERYPNRAFKVATLSKWIVVVGGRKPLDDIRKAPDDALSVHEAISEITQIKYTMGKAIESDPYHNETIRSPMTRNLVVRFDDIRDEIIESFKEYIPSKEGEYNWVPVPVYDTFTRIICRVSNRYFIGLPLCNSGRDPGYLSLNEKFTSDVVLSARILHCFPNFLKPLVGRYLTTVPRSVKQVVDYLGPIIQERLAQEEHNGPDRAQDSPNDLISWLLETAQGYQRTVQDISLRILAINFSAIQSSSVVFTQALYDLAAHPEYVKEMREEVETAIKEHGWSKTAMQKLRKVDSFLKESQRLNGTGSVVMLRKTLKDWSFSDGTLVPAGTHICIANEAMNKNEESFPEAHTFKGFRFSNMRDGAGELDSIKHQMVSLDLDQIIFGHGRHACPGRFFAVNEIKAMFAYILLTYDVQLEGGSLDRPQNFRYETAVLPDMKAKVLFRSRAVA